MTRTAIAGLLWGGGVGSVAAAAVLSWHRVLERRHDRPRLAARSAPFWFLIVGLVLQVAAAAVQPW